MRLLVCGLLLAGVASPAFAGDIDNSWLRGSSSFPTDPPPFQRWNGLYGGGQVGADFHGTSFNNDGNSTISSIKATDSLFAAVPMASLPGLTSLTTTGPSFGGFAGYNYQIDDIVLGFEFNFNQASAVASASQSQFANQTQLLNGKVTVPGPNSASFTVSPNFPIPPYTTIATNLTSTITYAPTSVSESNTVSAKLLDYGTVRLRGGWAFDNFLPYVAVGLSVSRIDTTQTILAHYTATSTTTTTTTATINTVTPPVAPATTPTTTTTTGTSITNTPNAPVSTSYVAGQTTNGKYNFGFSAALGLDYALTRNIFLRGEVEYLQLGTPNNVAMNTASARVGAGLKF